VQSLHAPALREAVYRWFTRFIAPHIFERALHAANVAVPLRNPGCQSP